MPRSISDSQRAGGALRGGAAGRRLALPPGPGTDRDGARGSRGLDVL